MAVHLHGGQLSNDAKALDLAKDPTKRDQLTEVLYESAEALRVISVLAHPVIPNGTQLLWRNLVSPVQSQMNVLTN